MAEEKTKCIFELKKAGTVIDCPFDPEIAEYCITCLMAKIVNALNAQDKMIYDAIA